MIRRLISENAQIGLDPEDYTRREEEYLARYNAVKSAMANIETQIQNRKNSSTKLAAFIRAVEKQNVLITKFDEKLWSAAVVSVTVYSKERIVFSFKGSVDHNIG